jgi:uncharacterized protein (DUF983 family)
MLKKLWLGFWLRCPNCEQGHLSDNFFSMRESCEVCHVRFERKSGESAGASVIWISVLPIIGMLIYFGIDIAYPKIPLILSAVVPLAFVLIAGALFYRNARGIWIAISYLTGGVYKDETSGE